MGDERHRSLVQMYVGPERDRVREAIVKLAGGDDVQLAYFLGVAMNDYRDVLFWADNPSEAMLKRFKG